MVQYVLQAEAQAGDGRRVDLHTHRRLLPAGQGHEADAGDLGDLLRQDRVGLVVDADRGDGVGADREREGWAVSAGFDLL